MTSGRAARILVAEDAQVLRALITAVLTADGHHIDCVNTTQDAVAALRASRYDLVVTDLMVPRRGRARCP
jgi:CheY-like chemotaxis protein